MENQAINRASGEMQTSEGHHSYPGDRQLAAGAVLGALGFVRHFFSNNPPIDR
jgi:hypothetical protein